MIEARDFVEAARQRGFRWYAGVPCSFLTPFINYVLQDHPYTMHQWQTKVMQWRLSPAWHWRAGRARSMGVVSP